MNFLTTTEFLTFLVELVLYIALSVMSYQMAKSIDDPTNKYHGKLPKIMSNKKYLLFASGLFFIAAIIEIIQYFGGI
jgi:Ca2+/Na+ antiporter